MSLQPNARLTVGQLGRVFQRALRYVGPFKRQFIVKIGLTLVSLLPLLLLPWILKIVIDHVVEQTPLADTIAAYPFVIRLLLSPLQDASSTELLVWTLVGQGVLLIGVGAFGTSTREDDQTDAYLSAGQDTATTTENAANAGFSQAGGLLGLFDFRWTLRLTQALNHHYRSRLFEQIHALPMATFDETRIGDAVYRVMYDTPSITAACYRLLLVPVASVLGFGLTVWVIDLLFGQHPHIIWAALGLLPLVVCLTLPFAGAIRRTGERSREAGATATTTIEEGMSQMLAVQSLGGQQRERERFDRDSWSSFGHYRRYWLARVGGLVVVSLPLLAMIMYAFQYAMDLVISGQISRGDFVLLLTYFIHLLVYAFGLGTIWLEVQSAAPGLQRVFWLMDRPADSDPPQAQPLPPLRNQIRVENVSFAYEADQPVLQDVSFTARVGQLTAIVGPAGAGKTTLASLIARFLSPQIGRILFDDTDLARATRASIQDHVTYMFQEHTFFDGTLEDNIRLAEPEAEHGQIEEAARQAGADGFITQLPAGYQTRLGRAGAKLSVGQKQRLSLARALVRNTSVLVLDEPSSALDPEAEQAFVSQLQEIGKTRLVIIITHRLSTAAAADQIVFLEDGRVRECGSPQELVARSDGAYRRYVKLHS